MATPNHTNLTDVDLQDVIDTKARQLTALLENTYGGAGKAFRGLNDQLQEYYLWACADMASDIVNSLEEIAKRGLEKRERGEVQHG